MKVSENFEFEEFYHPSDATPGDSIQECIIRLAVEFLEPIRAHFGKAIDIQSGYRSPRHNTIVGGVPTSYHLFESDHGAVDFTVRDTPLQEVFDWIRLDSHLPFDQVILERAKGRTDDLGGCIHLQIRTSPRRNALIGATHGQGKYQQVEVV